MDKDVATAIINQFPNYSQTVPEMANHLADICKNMLDSNEESTKTAVAAYQMVLDNFSEMLNRDELSFEEKQQVTSSMIDVADKLAEKNRKQELYSYNRQICC